MSPLLSPLQKPLIFLVVGYYILSYTCASALAQPEDETLHKMVVVPDIGLYAIEDPDPVKFTIDVGVMEDRAYQETAFRLTDIEMAQQEPDAIVSRLIRQFNNFSPSYMQPKPDRFAFRLAEPLPNWTTDEPGPGQPTIEDYMWLLNPNMHPVNREVRMNREHWQPWYNTFYMDGPIRLEVFHIGIDRKLYSGFIDIPPEAIYPAPHGHKVGYLRREGRVPYRLDFVRDLDDELRPED